MIKGIFSLMFFWTGLPGKLIKKPKIRNIVQELHQKESNDAVAAEQAHALKGITSSLYQQVHAMLAQNCVRSFGITPGISDKIEKIFKKVCDDFDETGENAVGDGMYRIKKATGYIKHMVRWAAKKIDQCTKEQCLMLHCALVSFRDSLAWQHAEIERMDLATAGSVSTLKQLAHLEENISDIAQEAKEKVLGISTI